VTLEALTKRKSTLSNKEALKTSTDNKGIEERRKENQPCVKEERKALPEREFHRMPGGKANCEKNG